MRTVPARALRAGCYAAWQMGTRGLGFSFGAALLLAGVLLWWSREDAQAVSPAADDGQPVSHAETELVSPAREPAPGSPRESDIPRGRRTAEDAPALDPSENFRGRVVDVATRTAVFGASVLAGDTRALTDLEGRFDLGIPLGPEVELVRVMNPCQGTHIRDARRETWETQVDGSWVLPIAIGPTFRLRLEAGDLEESELWRARVVEVSRAGVEHAWNWTNLCGEDPLWFRYDNPQEPTYPGPGLRLEVLTESGIFRGSTELAYCITGLHPHIPTVYASEQLALLIGVVIDEEGEPLKEIEVLAVRVDEPTLAADSTGRVRVKTTRYGGFELPGLTPGEYDLRFRGARGAEVRLEGVSVPTGETTLADVVMQRTTFVGSIRGRLVGQGKIRAQLHLRSIDGRPFAAFDSVGPSLSGIGYGFFYLPEEMKEHSFPFQFNDLPAGEYELEVLPLDGRPWSPRTMLLSPPAEGLVFTREEDTREAFFHVVDATSGREFEEFMLQLHPAHLFTPRAHPQRCDEPYPLAVGQPQRWVVSAPGYVPARGDEGDFHDLRGRLVATVRLTPGWGATLVLRDHGKLLDGGGTEPWASYLRPGETPPVPGVVVFVDGAQAGTSDARGVVHLRRDREPERIVLVGPGWTVLESDQFRGGRLMGDAREVVVWLTRR